METVASFKDAIGATVSYLDAFKAKASPFVWRSFMYGVSAGSVKMNCDGLPGQLPSAPVSEQGQKMVGKAISNTKLAASIIGLSSGLQLEIDALASEASRVTSVDGFAPIVKKMHDVFRRSIKEISGE
jgi:hypothetical protein